MQKVVWFGPADIDVLAPEHLLEIFESRARPQIAVFVGVELGCRGQLPVAALIALFAEDDPIQHAEGPIVQIEAEQH